MLKLLLQLLMQLLNTEYVSTSVQTIVQVEDPVVVIPSTEPVRSVESVKSATENKVLNANNLEARIAALEKLTNIKKDQAEPTLKVKDFAPRGCVQTTSVINAIIVLWLHITHFKERKKASK